MKNKFAFWGFVSALVPIGMYILFDLILLIFGVNLGSSAFNIISGIVWIAFFVFGALSLVFGIIGIKKAREEGGRTFSIIGMIVGGFLLLMIFFIMFTIFLK